MLKSNLFLRCYCCDETLNPREVDLLDLFEGMCESCYNDPNTYNDEE